MTIVEGYEAFILSRNANNFSVYTVKWYKMLLGKFINYLKERKIHDLEDVNQNYIRLFMEDIRPTIRSETLHNFYRVIKTFFNWLSFEELISKNPMKFIQAPKREKKTMRCFTLEEIEKMMEFFDRKNFFGNRNYTICVLLFDSGIRRAELCNIKLTDINHEQGNILIHGKGGKERIVPIGQVCRRVLAAYLKKRNEYLKEHDKPANAYLFINKGGYKIGTGYLTEIFTSLKKKLNIQGERVSPHSWRHTFARTFLLNGGDVFSLQQLMGHSDISTTKRYVALNDKELKVQHAKYGPLDNMSWNK